MSTIWFLNHYANVPQAGASTRHYDFCVELSRLGHNVVLLASSFDHLNRIYRSDELLSIEEVTPSFHVAFLRTGPAYQTNGAKRLLNMYDYSRKVRFYYTTLAERFGIPDCVLGSSPHPFSWMAARFAAKRARAPFIMEIRDLWPETFVVLNNIKRTSPLYLLFFRLERHYARCADAVVTTMPLAWKYLNQTHGIERQKVHWIGQPVNLAAIDRNKDLPMELLPSEVLDFVSNSFVFVYAGSYERFEGVFSLLEAFSLFRAWINSSAKLLFVGEGTQRTAMENYCHEHGLTDVLIGPRITKDLVAPLLNRADVCVASLCADTEKLYQYGLSINKLNDYLAAAKPVMFASSVEDNPVSLAQCGLTPAVGDVSAIANAMKALFDATEVDRRAMGLRGRAYLEANNEVSLLTKKLIQTLLGEKEA